MCRVANRDYELARHDHPQGPAGRADVPVGQPRPGALRRSRALRRHPPPNHHIAFGFGTHFCLGAALARLEIRMFFEELVRRVGAIRVVPGTRSTRCPNAFVFGAQARRNGARLRLTEEVLACTT